MRCRGEQGVRLPHDPLHHLTLHLSGESDDEIVGDPHQIGCWIACLIARGEQGSDAVTLVGRDRVPGASAVALASHCSTLHQCPHMVTDGGLSQAEGDRRLPHQDATVVGPKHEPENR